MSGTYAFVIVGPNDCPVYTADLSQLGGASSQSRQHRNDEQQHLYQFVLQASLDVIQETVWTSQNMFLKVRRCIRLYFPETILFVARSG